MSQLEQLCYMWSEVGLEERTGFQVRAASPGFTPRESSAAATALRLCRYSAPRENGDNKPVSYGWIDGHDVRFLFRRADAGLDAFGRPGAFVAHVAAGPPEELTPEFVTQRFHSQFWLSGDERLGSSTMLPLVGAGEVPAGPPPQAEAAQLTRFCAALIAARLRSRPLVIAAIDSELVASLMAGVARALPAAALNDVAFSTYETAETAGLFDVVGLASPDELPKPCDVFDPAVADDADGPELRLAQGLCGSPSGPTGAAAAALGAASAAGDFEYRVALDAHELLLELDQQREVPVSRILTYLREPSMIHMIVLQDAAADVLSGDLGKLGNRAWQTLAASCRRLSAFELRPLAKALRARSASVKAPQTDEEAVVALAASVLDDQSLPTAERERLLRAAAAGGEEEFGALLSAWLTGRLRSGSQGPPPPGLIVPYCALLASAMLARARDERPLLSLDEQTVLRRLRSQRAPSSAWIKATCSASEVRSARSFSLQRLTAQIGAIADPRLRQAASEYLADRLVCACVRKADVEAVATILAKLGLAQTPGAQARRMLQAAARPGNGAIQPAGLAVLKWMGSLVGEALPVERNRLADQQLQDLAARVIRMLPPSSVDTLQRGAAQHSRQAKKWVKHSASAS